MLYAHLFPRYCATYYISLIPTLTYFYNIELAGKAAEFKRSGDYNGILLWEFIRKRVNPTTATGASKYKGVIKKADLATFDNGIEKFST